VKRASLSAFIAGFLASAALAEPFTYVNERFGTSVTFPAEMFSVALPPPDNGDGQAWESTDGARLTVFGSYNVLEQTPQAIVDTAGDGRGSDFQITYSKTGKDWAVLSGTEGGKVFYERYEFGAKQDDIETIHAVLLSYPQGLKAKYDPVVGPVAASLTGP